MKYRNRAIFYLLGVLTLSFGVTLCTKSELGIAAITSVPYAISCTFEWNLSVVVFLFFCLLVALQFLLRGKRLRRWRDLLQIPFSFVYSALLEIWSRLLPIQFEHLWQNILLVFAANVLMGVGVALMVNMQVIPNPPDGFTEAFSERTGRELGRMKNIVDIFCVAFASLVGLVFRGRLMGVGIGTVISMVFVGRVISVFNHYFKDRILKLAGLEKPEICQ